MCRLFGCRYNWHGVFRAVRTEFWAETFKVEEHFIKLFRVHFLETVLALTWFAKRFMLHFHARDRWGAAAVVGIAGKRQFGVQALWHRVGGAAFWEALKCFALGCESCLRGRKSWSPVMERMLWRKDFLSASFGFSHARAKKFKVSFVRFSFIRQSNTIVHHFLNGLHWLWRDAL